MGWGTAIGKIFDWIPGRKENLRNKIDNVKREMAGLSKKKPFLLVDADDYAKLADKLRVYEQACKNN